MKRHPTEQGKILANEQLMTGHYPNRQKIPITPKKKKNLKEYAQLNNGQRT